jgi:Ig-like domain from next to BRCA1 gene
MRNGKYFLQGAPFGLWDRIVSTAVFHWFTPSEGNLSGAWTPLEGRQNWTGEKDWWITQIKQIMMANIDVIYVHLITRFEQQRINLFKAVNELRAEGYDVPKIAPFLDPFGIWPPRTVDLATSEGKDEVAGQYIRFFEQYFETNRDAHAASYLARIDGRVLLVTWWVCGIFENLQAFEKSDLEERLRSAFQERYRVFDNGIYLVSTALIEPDVKFADEKAVFFSGYAYCMHAVYNRVHNYHLQAGYWDQNIRRPGYLMARNGGRFYKAAWEYVLRQCDPHRIYIESWNEYDEGSGIYAADPGPPFVRPDAGIELTDSWSTEGDGFEYIKTTASGASEFNRRPAYQARILAHSIPSAMRAGDRVYAEVIVSNQGNASWNNSSGVRLAQKNSCNGILFGEPRHSIDEFAGETALYGGVFRGRPVTFKLGLSAPREPGVYTMKWSMVDGSDSYFGEELETRIEVS